MGVFTEAIKRRKGGIYRGNKEEPKGVFTGSRNIDELRGYSQGQYRGGKGVFSGAI